MEEKLIKISEAAEILGVSIDTLRRWDESGKLVAIKKGNGTHRYYLRAELNRFILDIAHLGLAWASSAQPPEIPPEYYCERQDRFTSRLEKMATFMTQADNIDESMTSLLTAVAGEIGDNSFMHNVGNWPDMPGIFFAYDINKRIIVLADRGQGIRKTLIRVRPNIETDIEAIRIAFTEIVSARAPEKRGNGLKVVRSIVETNPIGMVFRSGLGKAEGLKKSEPIKISMASDNIRGVCAVITF